MTHTKTVCAISNVRLPLLVGVSIAALSLSNGAALAQSVVANGGLPVGDNLQVSGTGDLIGSVSSTPVTGLTFYGSNTISIDGDNGLIVGATPADTTTITNGALTTGTGVISTFNGQTNLNGATTFGVGGTVGFNSGFTVSVGQNAWFGATTVIDGNGTIAVGATGQTTIDGASGSLTTAATTNLQGQTNFGATGQSFFDTNGNLQIGAAGAGVTLNTDGTASFGGAVTIGNAANGITLSPDGTSQFNGLATFSNGAAVTGGDLIVTNNASVGGVLDVSGNINGGHNINAANDVNVGHNLTVTNNANIGGSLTVSGQTTVNNFAVANGSTVSMGGNRVQDVATPMLGTDAANKAYVDRGINKAYEGTALALAISQPVFLPGQSFAVRAGWGNYEGENAFGFSAAGIISRDAFGYGSTVALDGGIGVGGDYNTVAGKAGVTIGFGGGYAPMK